MVGNRKERVEDGVATDYEYDATYQLTKAQTGPRKERYEYDDVGNRTFGPTVKDVTETYAHDDANRMTKGRRLDYAYDDLGRQTARIFTADPYRAWVQKWDGEGMLKQVDLVEGAVVHRRTTFKYDPFGRRVEKKVVYDPDTTPETVITTYVYDREDIIYTEKSIDGAPPVKTHYIHGPGIDEPLAMVRDGVAYYYHADGLGSIVAITDDSQNIVQQYSYESFGRVKVSNRAFKDIYTYTGREWDREVALHYYRARYYDPMAGRFISKDPIGFYGDDVNLYNYLWDNPVNFTDPFGLSNDSLSKSIQKAASQGNLTELETLFHATGRKSAQEAIKRLKSKAGDFIGKQCKGSINREFPNEMRDKTLKEIYDLAKKGSKVARKAKKLLNDNRFRK